VEPADAPDTITYQAVGVVRSPFTAFEGMPLQSVAGAEVRGATLEIAGADLIDGTPVLDIKPYVPAFDAVKAERTGWLEQGARRVFEVRADARFDEESAS
jgi:tRNA (Thr-GGU) A37 N-methylase